ncbi:hypothetical protein [Streptomyces sp. NPDC088180]|uniref:hypothetical protein n=1 Tax=Streptomyces sp. NPDC088180 TaxID=3365837 RepID=UPI003811D7DB
MPEDSEWGWNVLVPAFPFLFAFPVSSPFPFPFPFLEGTAMSSAYDVLVLDASGVDTIVYVPERPLPYAGESFARCALYGAIAGTHACTVPATGGDLIGRAALLAGAAVLSGA